MLCFEAIKSLGRMQQQIEFHRGKGLLQESTKKHISPQNL